VSDGVVTIAELFAGVGGFRLALDGMSDVTDKSSFDSEKFEPAGPFKTIWANQWEPPGTRARQFAWQCYERHFGEGSCVNQDIKQTLDDYEAGKTEIPDVDMVVGGFPCQDYSVAKPLSKANGIEGKKGVLWWQVYRFLQLKKPKFLMLENVDRLLKSPVSQRGRDFAVILSCLAREGYSVEWRVINAADYGMPQRRRRIYIVGIRDDALYDLRNRLFVSGVMAKAFPIMEPLTFGELRAIPKDPYIASRDFGVGDKVSFFQNAGVMQDGICLTAKVEPSYDGKYEHLRDLVVDDAEVPEEFFIPKEKLKEWEFTRQAKKIPRTSRTGYQYMYSEGAMEWPDSLDKAARTILTAEGGRGASRMKHAIQGSSGRYRRLVPDELDAIQMFPKGWTKGMSDGHRAFCMGNALVVGIPHKLGQVLASMYLD
jgi:DNA (cytosine-5)-methyltransferase 1